MIRIVLIVLLLGGGALFFMLSKPEQSAVDTMPSEAQSEVSGVKQEEIAQSAVRSEPSRPLPVAPPDEALGDEGVDREMVVEAMTKLNSPNEEDRVEAVEELAVEPGPDSEIVMGQLLISDPSEEVRNTAALGLGSVESPSEASVSALFSALGDQSEDVRYSALSTLEDYLLAGEDDHSPLNQRIRDELKYKLEAKTFPPEMLESIRDILQDQQVVMPH